MSTQRATGLGRNDNYDKLNDYSDAGPSSSAQASLDTTTFRFPGEREGLGIALKRSLDIEVVEVRRPAGGPRVDLQTPLHLGDSHTGGRRERAPSRGNLGVRRSAGDVSVPGISYLASADVTKPQFHPGFLRIHVQGLDPALDGIHLAWVHRDQLLHEVVIGNADHLQRSRPRMGQIRVREHRRRAAGTHPTGSIRTGEGSLHGAVLDFVVGDQKPNIVEV